MTATIHEVPKRTLADSAKVLRCIADEIDAGKYGTVVAGYIILENEDGEIQTFGSGAADYRYGFSLLALAMHKHINQ